jgi:hypothetical protein
MTSLYGFYYIFTREGVIILMIIYTFEHCNPHKVRIVFKGNVIAKQLPEGESDKSIKTHTKCAN